MVTIRSWKKELLGFVCCLLALVIFCAGASAVVLPKRYDYGSTWDMYLKEEEDTIDVMFFGSSLAYCDVVPATIYQETGITSYVMAGPEQTMPITYRYLKQACKTQSPQVVFLEATGMFYPAHSRSTAVNICYMPWSLDRLALTFQVAEPDEWPGLLFPPVLLPQPVDGAHLAGGGGGPLRLRPRRPGGLYLPGTGLPGDSLHPAGHGQPPRGLPAEPPGRGGYPGLL